MSSLQYVCKFMKAMKVINVLGIPQLKTLSLWIDEERKLQLNKYLEKTSLKDQEIKKIGLSLKSG